MVLRSDVPFGGVPEVTLDRYLLAAAASFGSRTALVDGRTAQRLTYADLVSRSERVAAGFAAAGLGRGDVIGLLSRNQPDYAVAFFAALRAGLTVTPVNPMLTPAEVADQLTACTARGLVMDGLSTDTGRPAAASAGLDLVWTMGAGTAGGTVPASGRLRERSFDELLATEGPAPRLVADPSCDVAVLPFSSGTTGRSRGVMLTHRNLVANVEQLRAVYRVGSDDTLCAVLPFFHIYGLTLLLDAALTVGATVVTLPRFDVATYLRVLRSHRVTRAHLVPPMVLALADQPRQPSGGSPDEDRPFAVRRAMSGAAPLDEEVARRAGAFLGCPVRQGYGLTEASPVTHIAYDEEFEDVPAGSVGRLLPGTEARVVDLGTGADVPAGDPGELWVRGPQVMRGYLGDPQATALALRAGGWLATGDVVRVDGHGYFWVVDRAKEMIKYNAYQVAPAELEALLLSHPAVADVAVVGVPHPTGGQAPAAFVVPREPVEAGQLMSWVRERVASYRQIREVHFVDAIPRSATGKILRRMLRRPG